MYPISSLVTLDEALANLNTQLKNTTWALKLLETGAAEAGADTNNIVDVLTQARMALEGGQTPDLSGLSTEDYNAVNWQGVFNQIENEDTLQRLVQGMANRVSGQFPTGVTNLQEYYQKQQIAESTSKAGIDASQFESIKQSLMELNPAMQQNKALADAVTSTYLNLDVGLRQVAEAWEQNEEALSNPDDLIEYKKAINNLTASVSELVGISVDAQFVEDNLGLVEDAIHGSTDALIELQKNAAIELVTTLNLPEDEMNTLVNFANEYNGCYN